jgi:Holliday junction resolvase RusA-like endonuclease
MSDSTPVLGFWVPGNAQTAGSKDAGLVWQKDEHGNRVIALNEAGNPKLSVREAGTRELRERKAQWRDDIAWTARKAMMEQGAGPWKKDEPLAVTFVFVRKRNPSHLTTGRHAGIVKDWARALWPIKRPDVLKHARAVEDALTGVVYGDDAQIVDEHILKPFADMAGLPPNTSGTWIAIQRVMGYTGPMVGDTDNVVVVPDQSPALF